MCVHSPATVQHTTVYKRLLWTTIVYTCITILLYSQLCHLSSHWPASCCQSLLMAVLISKTSSVQTATPSLRVPVLAPTSVAPTSGLSCMKPFTLPTTTFPTLCLSPTNWFLTMEQHSTYPVIRTVAVSCGCGCLLQYSYVVKLLLPIVFFSSLSTTSWSGHHLM